MDSAPHLDQNHEKDQTSIAQTLSAVRDICQRLEKWAMRDLADLHVSCSVLDLIQYCQATLEQCESQLVNQKPIQQSELVQEQVQRSPGAHESEPNKSSTQTLEMLLAECKLRTQQAAKLLDNKLRHLAEEKPIREEVARADVYRFFAAAKAIRNNTKADSDSLYLSETRSRVKRAVVSDLFPQLNAFGSELLSISESRNARNHSADNPFPEELQVQEILLKFMYVVSYLYFISQSLIKELGLYPRIGRNTCELSLIPSTYGRSERAARCPIKESSKLQRPEVVLALSTKRRICTHKRRLPSSS